MISICIPIYNYYAYPLVRRLVNQIEQYGAQEQVEVICIDDHSSGYYLNQNMGICDIATYLRLAENIGRSRIRNLFLKYAKGDWLLFLDNDALVADKYIKECLKYQNARADVVFGGTSYDRRGDDVQYRLRYLYGTREEVCDVEQRTQSPYRHLWVNNMMIRRSVFERIKFDPRISTYGYEDMLFVYRLETGNVSVLQVDNPIVHGHLESNAEYLQKVIQSSKTLAAIYNMMWEDQRFCHSIPLLESYSKIQRWKQVGLFYSLFKILKTPIESHLTSGRFSSLRQLHLYKLGILIRELHYNNSTDNTETK